MTISSSNRKAGPFSGNGVTVAFPFTFKVFAAADVLVVQALPSTGAETAQTLTTDYTVSLNADQNISPGGTVTMLVAPPTGYTLTLASQVDYLQTVDVTNNGGFYPKVFNNAFDKATIQIQQLAEKVSRSLKTAISTPLGVSTDLPAPIPSMVIGWNPAANALQNYGPTDNTLLTAALAASTGSNLTGHKQGVDAAVTTVGAQLRALTYRGAKLTVFGDSFTYGVIGETGAYSTENYANYISRAIGLPITNKAISGGLIIDLGSNFYNTATNSDDVFLTMTGYNDGRVYGSAANGLLTYRGVLRAMLVWLALPDAAKILANSASISYTGTWATLGTVYANKSTSKFTLTPTSSAQTVIKGDTIYIGHTRSVSTPAVFRVEIDGRDYGNFTNTAWTASNSGMVYGPDLLRISGLQSTKRHTVVITHISGGEFYLDYISGNGGANIAYPCPTVFSGNTVRMLDYSHELSSDAVVDLFNLAHRQVIAELVSDGLNIMHVDVSSGYDPQTHGSANPLEVHPIEVGQQYLKSTFLQAMAQDSKALEKNRRLENFTAHPGLYVATTSAEIAVSASTFTYIDFATYAAPPGWVYLPSSERSYFPQTPGYVELSVTITFKAPLLAGRYYFEVYDADTGAVYTMYDESRPASSEAHTVHASLVVYANGVGTRFRVRVYSSVATTISAGQVLTRFSAKFLGA